MYQQLYHSLLALRNAHTPTTPSSSKIVNGHAIRARKPCGGPGCGGVKHGSVKQCPLTIPNLSSSLVYVCVRMCVCAVCVQCVCPWAAVTSKQQSFEMTGPSDDSSATATGQVRDRSLSPSNTPSLSPSVPRLPSCSIPLYFSLPLSFVL